MKTEIVVFAVNYYDMVQDGGGKGASVRILGDGVDTNNSYGVSITDAEINFSDVEVVKSFNLPAKFSADLNFVSIKKKNNKEVAGIKLSNLTHVSAVEIKDIKKSA